MIVSYLSEDLALVRGKVRHWVLLHTCGKLWPHSLLITGADNGTVGLTA